MDDNRHATLARIESELHCLAADADAIGEALLPYLIEQAALEARKARERQ